MGTTLRIGDVQNKPTESMEIQIKLSKCTAIARPKSWKRVMLRKKDKRDKRGEEDSDDAEADAEMDVEEGDTYVELKKLTEYYRDSEKSDEDDDEERQARVKEEDTDHDDTRVERDKQATAEDDRRAEREELIKGFKYGSTYTPCPDGQFDRLMTKKGIDICGFFKSRNVRASWILAVRCQLQPRIR